jgi:hypothetical protein
VFLDLNGRGYFGTPPKVLQRFLGFFHQYFKNELSRVIMYDVSTPVRVMMNLGMKPFKGGKMNKIALVKKGDYKELLKYYHRSELPINYGGAGYQLGTGEFWPPLITTPESVRIFF